MSERFEFEREKLDGVSVLRWLGDPELEGWKRDDLWRPEAPSFVRDHAMFQPAGLLYPALLGMFWRVTNGLSRLALPVWDGFRICSDRGRAYELVRWEYGIDWEHADWPARDQGFVLAESFDQENKRFKGAAVTAVVSWAELVSVIPIGDQANTLCLFATTPTDDARQQLLATLRDDDTPSLRSILHSEGSALAVITQEDEGLGRSSILIAGNSGLGDLIDAASDELNERVGTYLVETAAASTRNEWAAATERLTAGFIEAS